MKVIMEFDLPEDDVDYTLAYNASQYWETLWEVERWLSATIRYENNVIDACKEKHEVAERIYDELIELLADNNVKLEDIP